MEQPLSARHGFVYVGTLDEAGSLSPDVHCFTAGKHPWIVLPEGVPAFAENYDEGEVWGTEAKARLEAVLRRQPPR